MVSKNVFDDIRLDYTELFVRDADHSARQFVDRYGLGIHGRTEETATAAGSRSVAVARNGIRLVLTEAADQQHRAASFVRRHGDGVADIAMRVPDAAGAFAEAVRRGACAVTEPQERDGIVTASVLGFGDVAHTFVQRPAGDDERALPGFTPATGGAAAVDSGLQAVDHYAVCLEAGRLRPTADFYQDVLDFQLIFKERIIVGRQAMDSLAVQSRSGAVTLTLIEPDLSLEPGQIDAFLAAHDGAGVQHIAFSCADIIHSVGLLKAQGVDFLSAPGAYFDQLALRLEPARHSVAELRDLNVLADEDHDGQLLQIFTRSTHPRGTLFVEIIERLGARTFGSGNVKALYEAVELQRQQDEAAS